MKNNQNSFPSGGIISLNNLPVGMSTSIVSIQAKGLTKRRMMDLGLVPGTRIDALRSSPLGDPRAFKIRGAVIAFREEDAKKILVEFKGD